MKRAAKVIIINHDESQSMYGKFLGQMRRGHPKMFPYQTVFYQNLLHGISVSVLCHKKIFYYLLHFRLVTNHKEEIIMSKYVTIIPLRVR